jgi:hypothetical protein
MFFCSSSQLSQLSRSAETHQQVPLGKTMLFNFDIKKVSPPVMSMAVISGGYRQRDLCCLFRIC